MVFYDQFYDFRIHDVIMELIQARERLTCKGSTTLLLLDAIAYKAFGEMPEPTKLLTNEGHIHCGH